MRIFLTLIVLLFIFKQNKAQNKDTILLMNGQFVIERVIDTTIGAVTIIDPKKPDSKLHYEYDQIYCVKYGNGFTDYFYSQDTLQGNYFTREEMLYYIYGERDARKGFKANGSLIGAGAMGIIGGGLGLFFAPVLPYGYMAFSGLPKVRIRHNTISNPRYIDWDAYILGYERVARSKRRVRAVIGGTIGLAVGYGLYFGVLKNVYPTTLKISFK